MARPPSLVLQPEAEDANAHHVDIARRVHQEIAAVACMPRWLRPGLPHLGLDKIDYPLGEGGEFVLARDGERAALPGVADLVEHRRDHADENVDRPAMDGDGVVDQRPGRVEIAPATRGKQRLKDVPQRDRMGIFIAAEQIRLFTRAFPAQPVRDAEVGVRPHLADELLAMGTPFQHALTPQGPH
jgi:hypothetical protein